MITYNGPIRVNARGAEQYAHGTPGFPCGCYLSDPSRHEIPWHWHDEMEFVHFREGEMSYLAGGERFVGRPGDGVFVNGGVPHSEEAVGGRPCAEGSLTCQARMLYGSREDALWLRYFRHLALPSAPQVVRLRAEGPAWERECVALIRRAWEAVAQESEFYEAQCRADLTRVCLIVATRAPVGRREATAPASRRNMGRLKEMVRFIEEHYAEELTSERIAAAGGVSQREAQREFQEVVGARPMEYLANHRLFVASQRLKSTDASIGEIARSCGFGSQSYFTKRFRERYGHSPTEHRRAH